MAKQPYLTLLRGINVGGNNIIKMVDLKTCFEDLGFTDVATYIQSGNVLFTDPRQEKPNELTEALEKALSKKFRYQSRIVVLSHEKLQKVIEFAPRSFGKDPKKFRYDVIFLKKPLSTREVMQHMATKKGVDQAYAGKDVLYFSRLIAKASQSHLLRLIQSPVYQNITVRNWNTTTKLLALMDARIHEKI